MKIRSQRSDGVFDGIDVPEMGIRLMITWTSYLLVTCRALWRLEGPEMKVREWVKHQVYLKRYLRGGRVDVVMGEMAK